MWVTTRNYIRKVVFFPSEDTDRTDTLLELSRSIKVHRIDYSRKSVKDGMGNAAPLPAFIFTKPFPGASVFEHVVEMCYKHYPRGNVL